MARLVRATLAFCAACVSLGGCGSIEPFLSNAQAPSSKLSRDTPIVGSPSKSTVKPLSYGLLYTFAGPPSDGANPNAGLIDVGGTLYGTTEVGGAHKGGTVFKLTGGSSDKLLHSFAFGSDGGFPEVGLIDVSGKLYGTASQGGLYGGGTLFSITTGGALKILHSFGKGADGSTPYGISNVSGTLYGTTYFGGAYGFGTVYSITVGGTEKVLHSFGYGTDGMYADSTLTNVSGTLYGTTQEGGPAYEGTVFSITTSGKEKVLHGFGSGSDGRNPAPERLINVGGTLYGTTYKGGTKCVTIGGCGVVFGITTSGTEAVLHNFNGAAGAFPSAGLTPGAHETLYGTTYNGGEYSCYTVTKYYNGCGTIFAMTTSGTGKVLHSFGDGSDGRNPAAAMIGYGGGLVGTTYYGGAYGYGTVFSLAP